MSDYWEERSLRSKQNQLSSAKRYERELKQRMSMVEDEIAKQIEHFVSMYAGANDITLAEAHMRLSKQEKKQWEHTLEEWRDMAIAPEYEYLYRKKMDSEYAKSQISRLEALNRQVFEIMAKNAGDERQYFEQALTDVYEESYYRNIYNIQDQEGMYSNFQQMNENALKSVVAQKWQGSDFSARLWGNYTNTLPSYLTAALTRGVSLGYGVDEMVREAKVVFKGFNDKQLHRLINTEMGHIDETATESAYKETDLEQYRYLATLEAKTCSVCGGLDYKVFNVKDIERGVNYPLIHPNCRCTTTPYIPEMDDIKGTRFARDPKTGKSMKVERMSFDEWKAQYLSDDIKRDMLFRKKRNKYDKAFAQHVDALGRHGLPNRETYAKTMFNGGRQAKVLNEYLKNRADATVEPLTDYRRYFEIDAEINSKVIGQYTSDNRIIKESSLHLIPRIIGVREERGNPRKRREGVSVDDVLYTLNNGTVEPSKRSDDVLVYKTTRGKVTFNKITGTLIQVSPQNTRKKKGG